ncbi:branched-chain amino acid transport protein (AzlD) [Firmicutes bacterium CAG:791]|nr:branched-chain amino acid transport protein (AzlD) [Firmicutes bacterium CAG:791]
MNTPISSSRIYLALMVMALTIYAVRVLPFLFLRKPIQNRFVRSFLFYVPYVTLAVMTFPAILTATSRPLAGLLALLAGLVMAWVRGDLFTVAITCCVVVFAAGLF